MSTKHLEVAAPATGHDASWLGDAALGLLLFAVTVSYLAALPLSLGTADEGHDLLGAKRVFDGEVLYRDVFSFTTPGWTLLMIGAFAALGPTLATARLTVAVIHGATALGLFLVCRQLGVGRALAWACGVAYVALVQPVFPIASYHWLVTFLCVLLLGLCLRTGNGIGWAFALGIAVGLPIMVHQQRGLAMGLGVVTFLVARTFVERYYGERTPAPPLGRRLAAFAAGVALVVGAVLAVVIVAAGFGPVWNALVIVPLYNYGGRVTCHWGQDFLSGGRSILTPVLPYLPLTLMLTLVPLAMLVWRRRSLERVRVLLVLTALCGAALVSILYHPDTIRIGLVVPLFLVVVADAVERLLRLLPGSMGRMIASAVAVAIIVAGGVSLRRHLRAEWAAHPFAYESAFGRIDLPNARVGPGWDRMRAVLDASPSRVLYAHPASQYTHLVLGARNAVRFPFTSPRFTSADQIREIIGTLETARVPYVLTSPSTWGSDDPIARYVREHYEPSADLPFTLWRRRPEPDGEPPPDGGLDPAPEPAPG